MASRTEILNKNMFIIKMYENILVILVGQSRSASAQRYTVPTIAVTMWITRPPTNTLDNVCKPLK